MKQSGALSDQVVSCFCVKGQMCACYKKKDIGMLNMESPVGGQREHRKSNKNNAPEVPRPKRSKTI